MIDSKFRSIKKLFVLSFKNGNIDPTRDFFDNFYTPLVETKDSNALIEKKKILDQLIKTNKKHMKNLFICKDTMIIQ